MTNGATRTIRNDTRMRKTIGFRTLCFLSVMGIAAVVSPAVAQSDIQGQSVADRNAPEFSSMPVRIGPFEAFPAIELTTEYNDNIFALNDVPREDVIFSLRPSLLLRDRRPDRIVRLNLTAGLRKYAKTNAQDDEQIRISADTRWGLGSNTEYRLGGLINRNTEQRRDIDSFITVAEPIAFTNLEGNAGITREFGFLQASLDGRVRSVEYDGFTNIDGERFDLAFRDFQVYNGQARLAYSRSRDQQFYVQLTASDRNFQSGPLLLDGQPIVPLDRSSRGGRLEVGYRQQLTELLYLDVRGGYLVQDFDDPTISSVDGLAFEADILWNVSPLTSIQVSGIRRVDDSINPLISGLVRTEGAVQVEHELLRNFIVTGNARYTDLNQLNSPRDGTQWSVGSTADYRLDRNWSLTFRAEHFERNGLFAFTQNEAGVGVRYNF